MKQIQRSNRRGVLTVEMAIVLPLFFLFLFTSIELSRMNTIRHTVENAAYEAARAAIIPGGTSEAAEAVAIEVMQSIGVVGTSVTTIPETVTNDAPDVEVFVNVPCDENAYFVPAFFGGRSITGRTKLTRERL